MDNDSNIAIVGVGPVGGILAAHLSRAGHNIVVCDIQVPHLNVIKERGLSITGVSEIITKCKRVAYNVSELANFPDVDKIIIATKASILPEIIPQIAKISRSGMKFISCQNGLENEEYLAETFGSNNVLRMVINYGGSQMGDGNIYMAFINPPNYIGAMTAEGEPLAQMLAKLISESGLETRFTTNIAKYEWEKAVLNAAMSPVCALTRKPMKDMMDLEITELLIRELLKEGIAVAESAGIAFDKGFFELALKYLKKAGYHRTSMHQDILRRFPTEIDWINGKIIKKGITHGVLTPYNFAITALINGLEMESGAPEEH
jgi:2-dehydropantoate 2-reductase